MVTDSSLKLALKSSDPIVKKYVTNLESQIAKLEAQNTGDKSKIVALQKELKKLQSKQNSSPSIDEALGRSALELLNLTVLSIPNRCRY